MNPLTRLWRALGLIAAALEGLAGTIDHANVEARARLGMGPLGDLPQIPVVEEETPAKKKQKVAAA